ncbi:MAG: peptidoglycan DD-metalloendopeptidase family protein [Candidatus Accumulibacter sp.]|nr:peptidoglycan DD-metalloendopeptidase family protein [Accumulibacter sp.]
MPGSSVIMGAFDSISKPSASTPFGRLAVFRRPAFLSRIFLGALCCALVLTTSDSSFAARPRPKKRAASTQKQTRAAAERRAREQAKAREDARAQEKIKAQVAGTESNLKELRGQINALRKEMVATETRRASAVDQLKSIDQSISTTQRELHTLARQRDAIQKNLKDIGFQEKWLETRLAEQQNRLESLVFRQYVRGDPYSLQVLLNGGDPNQMARDLYYLSRIGGAHRLILMEIENLIRQKQALAETTQKRASELDGVEAQRKKQHEKLLAQQTQRKTMLDKISARIQEQRREIGNLERDEKRLSQLVERLAKILAEEAEKKARAVPKRRTAPTEVAIEATPEASSESRFARLRGSLRLPTRGVVTNRFGAPRQEGSSWKGLFIRAAAGSEVKSIASGRVVFADWMRGFGNLMIVDHGDNYLSIYGNNDALLKQVGDATDGGDVIASVGNSGGNPESGLYFEIRYRGQPLDPLKWASLK